MGYCTKKQIESARTVDILTYLRLYEPSRGVGGKTALDYLVSVRNVPFTRAVEMLCSGNAKAVYPVSKPRDRPKAELIPPEKMKTAAKQRPT